MKPTLQLKLTQQLKLTPQLQQSIRLLQLSTLELNQEIERIVQENPLLELRDDWSSSEANNSSESVESPRSVDSESASIEGSESEADIVSEENFEPDSEWLQENSSAHNTFENDDWEALQVPDKPLSLRGHLNFQVSLSSISEYERKIIGLLIDSLNDDGYLLQDLGELVDLLPAELGIDLQDLESALMHLQQYDPPGVGARDLKECLVLQLQALPGEVTYRAQAIKVVQEYLGILASHDFAQVKKLLGCDDLTLKAIQKLITNLNPKPGIQFNFQSERYIIPDITVVKRNGVWLANLNMSAIPRLNINHLYANILKQEHHSARGLISQLNEAKWLIKNVQQRSSTILKVAGVIVERQQQFFEHGEVAMRPLVLREIAETLNLHESTVSRVTTQKYMYTPRGIFELKYFFGSHVSTDSGGACSATAIRALIKQLIQEENSKKPLSDNKISTILEQQGIVVARRTIAKYRESLQIPAANLRKSI
ncbi:RNA polymerase factor sigma-54 [Nitrosomonas ureae]|uniref:RNA polymerase sigma-54 factor n=1 Tax=Nitrosomonas ureae TaxID=44577 RepID=A0A1H2E3T7_9PROT|nr:RNA polymerase factor sigma-54 [Nitrosomonas ureae]ALQ52420.1 RNA polymerase sigma-54 factor [Nitrosomonas ureae]SDT89368.1 RNA polymerase, sigma 54 subunit, RpoN/SigL [Nitrosomonas ureae]